MSPSSPSALDPCADVSRRDTSYAPRRCRRRDAHSPTRAPCPLSPQVSCHLGTGRPETARSDTDRRRVGVRWVRPVGARPRSVAAYLRV